MRRFLRLLLCGLVALALWGCSTTPIQNQRLPRFSKADGYRFRNISRGENSDSLFVVLTFSGGGTRASAFSYGVLEELARTEIEWDGRRRRLLDEVDVISSVSGGSITAAYYGLFGDRIFEDFRERVLYRDLQGDLISQILKPRNYRRLASPYFGKTHLLAEELDERVYDGKTFGDLLARNTRPFLIINATDAANGGRFEFTQDQFDLLYSDLASYPVGHAVAASAAVPAVLSAMGLRNYPKGADYVHPEWIGEALANCEADATACEQAERANAYRDSKLPYVLLVDGGVSDNLGLVPVVAALGPAYSPWSISRRVESGAIREVVIITVNAKNDPKNGWEKRSKRLGLIRALLSSSSIPMAHFTRGQIEYLKLLLKQLARETPHQGGHEQSIPTLSPPGAQYRFIEVAFSRLKNADERRLLNEVPTALGLPKEDVDRLRKAAGEILREHPVYVELLDELQPRSAD